MYVLCYADDIQPRKIAACSSKGYSNTRISSKYKISYLIPKCQFSPDTLFINEEKEQESAEEESVFLLCTMINMPN